VKPTAKSVILDLLSTLGGRAMPVRALVAAASLFGIGENPLRVALARLLAAGTIERDERGAYRLGERARGIQRQVRSWRRLEERVRSWSGDWIAVHTAGLSRSDRAEVRRRERALRFFGFQELAPGLDLRPANLAGGVAAVRDELVALGLDVRAPVFTIDELDVAADKRARRLWNGEALVAAYRASRRRLEASAARLPELEAADAMVESFVLGGRVIRQLVLDPLLPEPIVPAAERTALAQEMNRYDKLGRAAWRELMREYGVLGHETPVALAWNEHDHRLHA
jgi:phenylacetic acid degradation operon negative regulatory protein